MKFTKLSLIATLAISSAFAGGDIAPVEPVVEAPVVEAAACNSNTTINGKGVLYSFTSDAWGSGDWYKGDSSALGAAVTLDVSHKFTENIAANITAVGFTNLTNEYDTFNNTPLDPSDDRSGNFEGKETGAFLNVANITATFGGTTAVLGRQLINTPMITGFDWLLAPGAFEAYTLVNTSIENLTFLGSYIEAYRPNNSGTDFLDLVGDNWTVGASYANAFDASIWYTNNDNYGYTQVYADAGYDFGAANVAAQYVYTDWDLASESNTYGIKVGTKLAGFDLEAAYVDTDEAAAGFAAGYIGVDGLYTTMWNNFAADNAGYSWKVAAATEFFGVSTSIAYADFENNGDEFDLILGYGVTDCISLDAIFTSTAYDEDMDAENNLELIATYKF